MNYEVFRQLEKIRKKHGPQEFGRICQVLLELTFQEIGFRTRGRSVERPDISAERGPESYAIEVKAPSGTSVSIDENDLDGLKDFENKGINPAIAVLAFRPNPAWLLLNARKLRPGKHNVTALRLYSLAELEKEIDNAFPGILSRYLDLAMTKKSRGLWEKLRFGAGAIRGEGSVRQSQNRM
jgi:Holliday junction resolvase